MRWKWKVKKVTRRWKWDEMRRKWNENMYFSIIHYKKKLLLLTQTSFFFAKKGWFAIMITKKLRKTLIFESIISQLIYGRFINFGVKNCCFCAVITKNQRKPFTFESLKTSLFYSCGQPFFTSKVVPILWCHLKKETFISESVIS